MCHLDLHSYYTTIKKKIKRCRIYNYCQLYDSLVEPVLENASDIWGF